MTDASPYEMVLAADIPARLIKDISKAKHSIHLQAMNFETAHQMKPVITAVRTAVKRGIQVTLAFDKISSTDGNARRLSEESRSLQTAGVTVTLLGKSLVPLPVAGRSHTKVYIIDDISYFGGGVNLYEPSFHYHDFMLRTVGDKLLLEGLHELIERQPDDPNDWQIDLGNDKILVDGGRRGDSLILNEAARLVKSAQCAWYVSQFSPGRVLEKELARLSRNHLKVWFNTTISSALADKPAALIDTIMSKLPNRYRGTRRIHAKFIVIQKTDGQYAAITGSHNFSDWGVRFGTKEAALYTTDQALCRQLIAFAESLDA